MYPIFKKMDLPPYDKFLTQLKTCMWLSGIPYGNFKIEKRFFIIACVITLMVYLEAAFFCLNISKDNFIELARSAPCISNGILSVAKGIQLGIKRVKIYQLCESLRQLYDSILVDTKKRQLVKHDLVVISMFLKPYIILNLILISIYNFSTLGNMLYHYMITNEIVLMLPFSAWTPFAKDTFVPWFLFYAFSAFCGFVAVIYYTTADGFYVLLSSQICANFRIISDMIENLDASNTSSLTDIVKAHQHMLKLAEDLEDIFMVPNLFNMLTGALQICAIGINIMIGPWKEIPGSFLFLVSVTLQILMMSIFGENIIRDSTKVGNAAYLSNWYNMDQKSKKIIWYIMIRAHKAQKLTAYKFSVICYSSFSKIMSTSWSYFTIIKTVYKPPETN